MLNPPKADCVFERKCVKKDRPRLNQEWLPINKVHMHIFFWYLGTSAAFRQSFSSVKNIVSGTIPEELGKKPQKKHVKTLSLCLLLPHFYFVKILLNMVVCANALLSVYFRFSVL